MNQNLRDVIEEHVLPEARKGYDAAHQNFLAAEEAMIPLRAELRSLPETVEEITAFGHRFEAAAYQLSMTKTTQRYWQYLTVGLLMAELSREIESALEPNRELFAQKKQLEKQYARREISKERYLQACIALNAPIKTRTAAVEDKKKLLGQLRVQQKGLHSFTDGKLMFYSVDNRLPYTMRDRVGKTADKRLSVTSSVEMLALLDTSARAKAAEVWDVLAPALEKATS